MTMVLAIWVNINELGLLLLSRGRYLECKYAVDIVGESVFIGFSILDLKTGYGIY